MILSDSLIDPRGYRLLDFRLLDFFVKLLLQSYAAIEANENTLAS